MSRLRPSDGQYLAAGVVASVVGFASAATIVLAGLRSVGASTEQASSGLLAVSVAMGALSVVLSLRSRVPTLVAWSTPGAALLISAHAPAGGWAAAIGAFLFAALLTVLAGMWRRLERAIEAIPGAIGNALLAGVLLPVCLSPARAAADIPALALPVIAAWLVAWVLARRWAAPAAIAAAVLALVIDGRAPGLNSDLLPTLQLTAPHFSLGAIIGIGIPLFVVTMASQNVPGAAILASLGYRVKLRAALVSTGAGSALAAPAGGHAVNLAAITAAIVAGPEAGPDRDRRWLAAAAGGVTAMALGLSSGVAAALIAAAPHLLVEAVAGLALLGALTGGLAAALADPQERDAAVVTLVVAASGITVGGLTAPFWALVAGLGFRAVTSRRST